MSLEKDTPEGAPARRKTDEGRRLPPGSQNPGEKQGKGRESGQGGEVSGKKGLGLERLQGIGQSSLANPLQRG